MKLWRITGGHFVAGLITTPKGFVVKTAPILKRLRGSVFNPKSYARANGYTVELVTRFPGEGWSESGTANHSLITGPATRVGGSVEREPSGLMDALNTASLPVIATPGNITAAAPRG